MQFLDWAIFIGFVIFIGLMVLVPLRLTKSVADFLAANRSAGRYMLTMAEGAAGLGAISLIAKFEEFYSAGFTPAYWMLMILPVGLIISLTGWVIFRFRQTRAMTLAQFLEVRYSRRFRIFAGSLCFLAGIVNYGIFPAVTGRFFLYFFDLPETVSLLGLEVSVFALIMFIMLSSAVFIATFGGQIAIIMTDFFQGLLYSVGFVAILLFLLWKFDWSAISAGLSVSVGEGTSRLNPFDTGKVENFNVWFYVIATFGMFYTTMAWQGSQGYNASARSPHEARMAKILGQWRTALVFILPMLIPACAYVVLNTGAFGDLTQTIQGQIATIENPQIQEQMTSPLFLKSVLPVGLMGLFATIIFAAALSTDNTYLHSWGSIFIQDVIMPIRGKPFTAKQHLRLLRFSILGVAIFAFFFSLLFRQTQYILLFFAVTGAIFLGGAGAVIIGGLYWNRGTTPAAWSAMITGSVLAVSGIVIKQVQPDFFLNGQQMFFIAMVSSSLIYIIVSLCSKQRFNLDEMLHRGAYSMEKSTDATKPKRGLAALGFSSEFGMRDTLIFFGTLGMILVYFGLFLFGLVYHLIWKTDDAWWLSFWRIFIWIGLGQALIITIWFSIGGFKDLKHMLNTLRTLKRDDADDGMVIAGHNRDEVEHVPSQADGK